MHSSLTTSNKQRSIPSPLTLPPPPTTSSLGGTKRSHTSTLTPRRKVIIATNIAETSLTIEGIVYVIDSGYTRLPVYDPLSGVQALLTTPTSQASAIQRAGRAGRTQPGHVYRLYTPDFYTTQMPVRTPPEICRSDLAPVLLTLLRCGISNPITGFDWIDPPHPVQAARGLETLVAIGAISPPSGTRVLTLTRPLGYGVADLPLDPRMGRALLAGVGRGVADILLLIAAMSSISSSLFTTTSSSSAGGGGSSKAGDVDAALLPYAAQEGDLITYANLLKAYEETPTPAWCVKARVNPLSMSRALVVRDQLKRMLRAMVQGYGGMLGRGKGIDGKKEGAAASSSTPSLAGGAGGRRAAAAMRTTRNHDDDDDDEGEEEEEQGGRGGVGGGRRGTGSSFTPLGRVGMKRLEPAPSSTTTATTSSIPVPPPPETLLSNWSPVSTHDPSKGEGLDIVKQCLIAGFLENAARYTPEGVYRTLRGGHPGLLSPESVYSRYGNTPPPYIIYTEAVWTSATTQYPYLKGVTAIDPSALLKEGPPNGYFIRSLPQGMDVGGEDEPAPLPVPPPRGTASFLASIFGPDPTRGEGARRGGRR